MKKQIAVLMAAATAVTTVAPVLASADTIKHDNVSIGEVEKKIADALADKYASDKEDGIRVPGPDAVKGYENSKYAVILDVEETLPSVPADKEKLLKTYKESYGIVLASETIYKDLTEATPATGHVRYVVTDAAKVKNLIEKRMSSPKATNNVTPTITPTSVLIVDKGVKDNKSTYTTTNKHYVAGAVTDPDTQVSLNDVTATNIDTSAGVVAPVSLVNTVTPEPATNPTKVTIELKSGKKIEVGVNSEALDFTAPKAEKQALTLNQVQNSQAVANQVVDFAKIANVGGVSRTLDLPLGETHEYKLDDVEVHEIAVPTVYTKAEGYSKAGADLINPLIRAKRNDGKLSDNITTTNNAEFSFNYKGVNYALATDAGVKVPNVEKAKLAVDTANAKIDVAGDGYVLRLNVRVLDKNDKDRFKTLQFKFEGKTQQDLSRVLNDLKGDNEVVVGKFVKLAGSDRAATAVEVSKERFGYKEADSVVVVGANALIDGLSAAPLAAAKKAPVLIAGKNGLDNGSLAEIERACKDLSNKTVYIVGGENSVPYAAKKQLEDKFGAVVVRLAGDDRYDTSLEVDHRLFKDGQVSTTRFVVGGNGAADAMSASAVAAKKDNNNKVSPILVVRKDGIKLTTRTYLAGKVAQAYVVGGTSTASTQVFKDIEKVINQTPASNNVADNKVKRLSGDDRYATNLAVINEFYKAPKANGLAVVSGKTQYLVDAQTAGAFAADRGLAVLLTADKLNKAQEDTLANGALNGLKTNIYQVGGVVSNDVMKSVVDILGL
ncbi:cell wall-binding repeat-containing protein [Peptostreptococcus stomatis]|uniref:cell wall-binding repeat-containing protein n=1 Tax=Peptostreptococcus stomatis TaxID=341694 RepID=UPI0026EBBB78|nr:cell wall-binding repeat-containing protein [Peptostreptococcus stomatis]